VTRKPKAATSGKQLAILALGALGVVYGDIGTSPLYALKECFIGPHGVPVSKQNVLGVLSLIFWSLNFIVTFKYLTVVMRADNRGEGGILALLALVRPHGEGRPEGRYRWLIATGLFGAALLYGDGIITPAISVLGAVEGLSIATPALGRWVVPIAVILISVLFAVQRRGTAGIGAIFGPVTGIWFVCIAVLGVMGISRHPSVLAALNPWYALSFLWHEGTTGVMVLAAVVLVVTGGEALYADMGHFGKRPIRAAWYTVVLPALALNYFGQGAILLESPAAAHNPFYSLVPGWALYPMVGVATAAAIVASQALISGAFSLTRQAVQLGYCPRVNIVHTSSSTIGQIYIPQVNNWLWIACVGLVLAFQSSSNLAATYGVAVTGTMATTTVLLLVVARNQWHWSLWKLVLLGGLVMGGGPGVLRDQPIQDPRRRLVPAHCRHHRVPPDVHLEEGSGPALRDRSGEYLADRAVPHRYRAASAAPSAWRSGVPHLGHGRRPSGAAAPPEAQQGAAREGDAAVGDQPGDPSGEHCGTGPLPGAGAGVL
jgi:KUP system potassium uptake protein